MLDPRFEHVAQRYQALRAQYDAGTLSGEAFEAALRGMMIEDGGRYWHIGAASGHWFRSDGDRWVEAMPPEIGPPSAEPESLVGAAPHPTPAPSPAPPPASTPHPVAQPQPAAAALRPVARSSGSAWMVRTGLGLILIGVGSFILPLVGMQFRIIDLFGPAAPVVSIGMAIVGVVLLIMGNATGGGSPRPISAQPARPAAPPPQGGPAAAGQTIIYQQPPYTPRGPGGCLIGCLVAVGIVIFLLIAAFLAVWPQVRGRLDQLRAQAAAESSAAASSDNGTTTGDTGEGARFANGLNPPPTSDQPSCPPGYVPPAPQLGSPESGSQPACVPAGQ